MSGGGGSVRGFRKEAGVPPNKGMKLTKPGELRSFAAYPRCSTDRSGMQRRPGGSARRKRKLAASRREARLTHLVGRAQEVVAYAAAALGVMWRHRRRTRLFVQREAARLAGRRLSWSGRLEQRLTLASLRGLTRVAMWQHGRKVAR